ncbi:Uncharacterised protein [uncultured archaeon]|nr:Uncharacterised protein [uncultured archaeon]
MDTIIMRFILLGLNVIVLVLLGAYLLDFMGISALGMNTLGALFLASVAGLLVVDQMVEKLQMTNPWMYLVPGIVAVVAPVIIVRQVSVITLLGVLFTVPGIVLFVRKTIK